MPTAQLLMTDDGLSGCHTLSRLPQQKKKWPSSTDSAMEASVDSWVCCGSSDEGSSMIRVEEELGSIDSSMDIAGSTALLSKLERSQKECGAWQRHAQDLAKRLTVERWQRSGLASDGPSDGDDATDAEPSQEQQGRRDLQQEELPSDAGREAAPCKPLPPTAHPAAADDSAGPCHEGIDPNFVFPGRCGPALQALTTLAAAGGWLAAPREVELGSLLGAGAFGKTYKGRWRGAVVAVKHVMIGSDTQLSTFLREVECLSGLRHPAVVPFLGAVLQGQDKCWLIAEYMPNGTLANMLETYKATPWGKKKWLLSDRMERAAEIASSLAALEVCDPPILHRDVKPSNILIDGAGRARLADFGLARRPPSAGQIEMDALLTGETGTYLYMSPENMRHEDYDSKSDVWSFGVLLAELATCQTPYTNTYMTPVQVALSVSAHKLKPTVPGYLPDALKSLCARCCEYSPAARPAFADVAAELRDLVAGLKQQEAAAAKARAAGGNGWLSCFSSSSVKLGGDSGLPLKLAVPASSAQL